MKVIESFFTPNEVTIKLVLDLIPSYSADAVQEVRFEDAFTEDENKGLSTLVR